MPCLSRLPKKLAGLNFSRDVRFLSKLQAGCPLRTSNAFLLRNALCGTGSIGRPLSRASSYWRTELLFLPFLSTSTFPLRISIISKAWWFPNTWELQHLLNGLDLSDKTGRQHQPRKASGFCFLIQRKKQRKREGGGKVTKENAYYGNMAL